jgi:Fur family iron response transcriptional regulator
VSGPNEPSEQDLSGRLRAAGVRPSAQRMAVAQYVLTTDEHPSAEQVHARVTAKFPFLSRATVYNTLNLFVKEGLLRQLVLSEGSVVFDPKLERHHHFVDDTTGRIEDIPWEAVRVGDARLDGYSVREYMVVLRGKKLERARRVETAPKRSKVTTKSKEQGK